MGPSVLWISLESVRYDHTSLSGYSRDTTPNLSALANEPKGKSFSSAFSTGVWTRAAVASLLTCTYPSRNGVGFQDTTSRLPDRLETVPELFQRAGYNTACLTPNPHISPNSGLNDGFDEFRYFRRGHLTDAASIRSLLTYVSQLRTHSAGYTTDTIQHSLDYLIDLEAKQLLQRFSNDDDPFFMYVHHGDPHRPYSPPLPYRDEYSDEIEMDADEAYEFSHATQDHLFEHMASGADFTQREWDSQIAMYDAAIKYTDHLVGDLVSFVRALPGETIVVVTGDHGELFGEHDMIEHRLSTHDAVTHVPLVVHGSDTLSAVDDGLVQHLDVMRTLLEAEVGIDSEQLQGYDLSRDVRDCVVIQRGYQRYRSNVEQFKQHDVRLDLSQFHEASVHAFRTERFKYLTSNDRTELFKLPDEDTDVSAQYPEMVARFAERASEFLATDGKPISTEREAGELDDDMRAHLTELGYLTE